MSLALGRVAAGAPSKTSADARRKVLRLYRACLRSRGTLVQLYSLPYHRNEIGQVMRREFEKHKRVGDLKKIDQLVFKGRLELAEANALFKTKSHVLRYFDTPTMTIPAASVKVVQSARDRRHQRYSPSLREFFVRDTRDSAL
eukprot:CAMPEP_0198338924 /NCGR_PEP_ID=MMETSP1450-20131203/37627_1 /TAXON_ID=753684 ORGANISM="Madagascaria erythrocladiodes, Strain CCMP3234" /NCGR_SAMPLE_ID=MMETSP1450 /ASSEMBLY_ACC=CAM_ASM_001115 /LENGTH=142 /DNA_ID=CAMNT_0044043821 /DNA_START=40 /DNA_END=468 /DNA_ORIENTATION=-